MSAPKIAQQVRFGGASYWGIRQWLIDSRRSLRYNNTRHMIANMDFDRWSFNHMPKLSYFDRYNEWLHSADVDEFKGLPSRMFLDFQTKFFTNIWLGAFVLYGFYYLQIENGRLYTFSKWKQVAADLEQM
eukprot:GDKI01026974.1.p1 GENE.GDKI01026974.1~~GDKI01026974.1.p1  ORF type:complete len:130 (+),score=20.83 GDKI01026974.1:99-488(+)